MAEGFQGRQRGRPIAAALIACVVVLGLGSAMGAGPFWPPKEGVPMTRWGKQVSSDKPVLPEYPRPQLVRQQWLNINGPWDYAITGKESPAPGSYQGKILVPFPIESVLSQVNKRIDENSRLWYRRTLAIPAAWSGRRMLLHFGAVDWEAVVAVNGKILGTHRGGYDGFSYDITDALVPSGPQELSVSVWDPTDGGQPNGKQTRKPEGIFYTPVTGIWQTVWLEPVAVSHIEHLKLVPDVDGGRLLLTAVAANVQNSSRVDAVVSAAGQEVARGTGKPGEPIAISIPQAKLWWPDAPFLYDLRVTLRQQDKSVDAVASYFGMRKISVGPDRQGITRILLNNQFVLHNGMFDQGFWPDGIYTAPSDEALRYDIEMTRKLGFNMARKHIKVEPDRWYYWADKLGLMVWQDMPSSRPMENPKQKGTIPDMPGQFERELRQMIAGRINHPSIVMWVLFNEGWGLAMDPKANETPSDQTKALLRRMVDAARQEDPTRLINHESGAGGGGWQGRNVWDVGLGDIVDFHCYGKSNAPVPEKHRASVIGEYGWGLAPLSCLRFLGEVKSPGASGLVLTQTTDVEYERNGALTYDRILKEPQNLERNAAEIRNACGAWYGPGPDDQPRKREFPAMKLRAYGTLAGEEKRDGTTSSLIITAENAEKAKLVLAKYLSDMDELPGVAAISINTSHGAVTAHAIEKQGAIAALRFGDRVAILAAPDAAAFSRLIDSTVPKDAKIDASTAEVEVPMYLDRWDKYGFRFYYGPFTKPRDKQGRDIPGNYDPRQDFEYADKSSKTGLVVWTSPFNAPAADNIFDIVSREWAFKAAKQRKLPLGVNIGLTDANIVLTNRYPDAVAPFADCYLGGWYYEAPAGIPTLSFASQRSREAGLSQLKDVVANLNGKYSNIVNWLEPHEEMGHGIADLLDDRGPDARRSFYEYLNMKFGSVGEVSKRYAENYAKWDDVPFPELATFFGYEGDVIDLEGRWRLSTTAAYDASSAAPTVDDSTWPKVPAPGHAIARFTPRKPTVLRRHINIDAAWRAKHLKAWLYCWDLENTGDKPVCIYVNGELCPENPEMRRGWHFSRVEISGALKDGDNLITLELPTGLIIYRTYITGEPPATYPALATVAMNARYADWSDWCSWSRGQALRRGMQMIRQVDPDKPITLMASGAWWNDFKQSAEDYGGILHDTGGMAGFWNDICPSLAQSTGLPTDCEPGGPALDLDDFKRFLGRWSTENTQGVDYFMHLGDVLWRPDIKDYFDRTQPLWHVMGKYHLPQPEVADLTSLRAERLFSFPMNLGDHGSSAPDLIAQGPGVFASSLDGTLASAYSRGSVIESDFANGDAEQYRVIVDTNSSILDPDAIANIAEWVKRGGTFITFEQTGRHTSTQHDAWPISALTGYDVTAVERKGRNLRLAAGQTVLPNDALRVLPNNWGLSLKKHDANDASCQDVALWEDGTVAAGARKLGKGLVINFGMFDSVALITQALDKIGIKHVPGHVTNQKVIMRHFVSNNGLYDVWTMWNQEKPASTTNLVFDMEKPPVSAIDVNTGQSVPISSEKTSAKIAGLAFESLQTRVLLTPRNQLTDAPTEWFWLQRGWWRGTADPGKPMAKYAPKIALDLTDDNAFKILPDDGKTNPPEDAALSDPKTDDTSWPKTSLGTFDIPKHTDAHHAVFRKHFTVPAAWKHGQVSIFGKSEPPENGSIRRYMDGKPFGGQIVRDDLGGSLKPGTKHVLTTEIWGNKPPLGTVTPAWISYMPDPDSVLMLNTWTHAPDFLTHDKEAKPLPYHTPDHGALRCIVDADPKLAGNTVMLHVVTSDASLAALIVNGHFYAGYGNIYNFMDVNATPFIKFGRKNEVIVVVGGKTILKEVRLGFYEKGIYP